MINQYFAYVIKSEHDGRLYKGHTQDLERRIEQHNLGKTRSTRLYIPWKLVYFETFNTREEAIIKESYFKSGSGREYLNKVINKAT